ncbi:basic proline-rich protein-like [Gallus gallus]|uniref:basic proline-rich protein-like n=1 Tax=Gallus gallus TaxID=9031 RepID=UPI001AE70376|nr:basic proline-rich protein-like [Gallus gallus]
MASKHITQPPRTELRPQSRQGWPQAHNTGMSHGSDPRILLLNGETIKPPRFSQAPSPQHTSGTGQKGRGGWEGWGAPCGQRGVPPPTPRQAGPGRRPPSAPISAAHGGLTAAPGPEGAEPPGRPPPNRAPSPRPPPHPPRRGTQPGGSEGGGADGRDGGGEAARRARGYGGRGDTAHPPQSPELRAGAAALGATLPAEPPRLSPARGRHRTPPARSRLPRSPPRLALPETGPEPLVGAAPPPRGASGSGQSPAEPAGEAAGREKGAGRALTGLQRAPVRPGHLHRRRERGRERGARSRARPPLRHGGGAGRGAALRAARWEL